MWSKNDWTTLLLGRDLGKRNWKSCYYSLHDSYCNIITSLSLSPSSNPCPPTTFHIRAYYTIESRDSTLTTRKPRNSFSLTKTFVSHSKYFYYVFALTRTLQHLKQGWRNPGRQVARTTKFWNWCLIFVVSENRLSLCHLNGVKNFVLCVRFLENLCTYELNYAFELIVSAARLHY
jgi:hypothetical protein